MSTFGATSPDPHPRKKIRVNSINISYVDTGHQNTRPIVFLHGNPTSSYLWRNIIPHVSGAGRCLAPDLIGMGDSDPSPDGEYDFFVHSKYLDSWFEILGITNAILVLHDWGSALGLHWAFRNPRKVSGIVYMEALVRPMEWHEWPENARAIFQAMRSSAGEEIVLKKNVFVEKILPASIIRDLSSDEMEVYRKRFVEPGESRRPTLTWPRQIPIGGEPERVVSVVHSYSEWMSQNDIPKLFINADPGSILTGPLRDFCRTWPNQTEITVKGLHFIQEDSPNPIGIAIKEFHQGISGT